MASTSAAFSCTKQLESGEARKSGLGLSVVKLNKKKKLFHGGEMSYATRLHLFGDRDLTEDREKFKMVSNHAKYRMEGVKERYGKAATEEVEYEEGEVEHDRAGGVINCRETVVPTRGDDTSFVINNRRYMRLWRYFWLDEYSCGKSCIECAARIGNPREGIPEEMPRLIGKKEKKFAAIVALEKELLFANLKSYLEKVKKDKMREEGERKRKRDSTE